MSPSSMQQQVESQLLASYESLYRLAYTYVKNPDDAMDVVQESAFKAISRSADVRSPAAIRGWPVPHRGQYGHGRAPRPVPSG